MDKFAKAVGTAVVEASALYVVPLFLSLPIMWLWNGLLPDLFGFKTISWPQALGLSVLSGMLFKPYYKVEKE